MDKRQSPSFFAALFGRKEEHKPAVTRGAAAPPHPFQAISIHPGAVCCAKAKQVNANRFLGKNAPSLPLPECTMRATCKCRYVKHADRRSGGARREGEFGLKSALFAAEERRRSRGRRRKED